MKATAVFLALLAFAVPADALPARLRPIDQCSRDRGFERFRARLAEAVIHERRDVFLQLVANDVIASYRERVGRPALARQIDAQGAGFWKPLKSLTRLGCARTGSTRVIPSLHAQFQSYGDEDYGRAAIALDGATLRKRPGGAVLATLSWDVVSAGPSNGGGWTRVELADGRRGWMSDDQLYRRSGYHFLIEQRRGEWRITGFDPGN